MGARREKPSAVVAETAEGLHRPVIMMGHGRNASLDNVITFSISHMLIEKQLNTRYNKVVKTKSCSDA